MNSDLLIELGWKSALCAGATLLLLRALRARSAAEKSMIAHLGLLALILLPLGVAFLPELRFATPAPVLAALPDMLGGAEAPAAAAAALPEPSAGVDWSRVTLALYLLPALVLLLALAIAVGRLHLIRARAEVLVDPLWLAALAGAQRRLGFKHGTALLTSAELNSPVSWGVVRPIIILDPAAAGGTADAEAIIAHELAHVVRLDWLKLMVGRLATALFWFNPLVWILARQSHHLCEEAADDAVLRADIGSVDYAQLLLGAARHANGPAFLAANGVAPGGSSLSRRIAHVLDASRPRRAARLGWAAASLAGAVGANMAIAAATPIAAPIARTFSAGAGESAAAELSRLGSAQSQALALAIRRGDWAARGAQGGTMFSDPAALAPLVQALRDDDPSVRRIAIWGLSEMRPAVGAAAAGPIAALLDDAEPAVRAGAARALGEFGLPGHASAVARLLRDPVPAVRLDAAHALGDLQSPDTAAALEAALGDPDPAVRVKARWALRQVREAEALLDRYRGG